MTNHESRRRASAPHLLGFAGRGTHTYSARALGVLLALCLAVLLLAGCSSDVHDPDKQAADASVVETPMEAVDYTVTFNGTEYTTDAKSAVATDGKHIVLVKGGVYRLTGERTGQIQVSVAKTERVTLILDGLTVRSENSAALYIRSADTVCIEVPEGKTSTLSDGASYIFENINETKPNACIYGEDDLVFRGKGTLIVTGSYNNAIGCKNDIVMTAGTVIVTAANNGVKGNGSVTLTGTASLTVTRAEDGIRADSTDPGKGWVRIEGQANAYITCTDDAIQALTSVTVSAGAHVYYDCEGQVIRCDGVTDVFEGTVSVIH